MSTIAVVAWSVHVPGEDGARAPEDAAKLLGRKGLLFKEPATRLALCAVHEALGLPVGKRPARVLQPRTAVVACSNLGNVGTVVDVAATVAATSGRDVSPMAAPNASSNVVASTVALWFGFGGPNLMVCSGADAGLDGLALAGLLLRADRADRVVLVAAEPEDDVAVDLHGGKLRAGAACLILERPGGPAEVTLDLPGAFGGRPGGPGESGDHYGAEGLILLARAVAGLPAGTAVHVSGPAR